MTIYKHSNGIIFEVSTEKDLTDATSTALLIKKPSNKTSTWPAIVYGDPVSGVLTYTTVTGDLNEDGFYFMQSYAEFPSSKVYYGNTVKFKVYDAYEVP
jgi:hypothetical protein